MTNHSALSLGRARTRALAVAIVALLLAALLPGAAAEAKPADARPADAKSAKAKPDKGCDNRNNNTYQKLLNCISAEGILEHLEAFQAIADANEDPFYPGTRAAGTQGYQDSVDYVAGLLEDAGWKVTLDAVEITFNFPATLEQLTPIQATYETGVFTGSGDGEVEGPVYPVDINLEGDRANTSGCEPEDFAGIDLSGPNDIVLVQRGTCFFAEKAVNAEAAGAEAVIIFNQGDTPDREGLIVATAANLPDGSPSNLTIPVVGASFDAGVALAQEGSTAFVEVLPSETRTDFNVIAELPGKNTDNVVMAGAHLDSVIEGPGIQDNGTGSAALLELALSLSKLEPENTLRFAWWAAEEQGLVGSNDYVAGLDQAELDRIAAYLNFDMIASPNFVYGVYDADQSSFPAPEGVPIPEGSVALEDLFEQYFTWQGIPYDDSAFSGRSDYQAFIFADIPASGLFTGAEVVKSEEQEAIWEGVAGAQFDPCYHLACDSLRPTAEEPERDPAVYAELEAENDLVGNVSLEALGVNSDAIAFAVLTLAYSTEDVNGVEGRMVPGSPALKLPTEFDGPQGTGGTVGSGAGPGPAVE
jgi:Zn-dependent M28 family amino/carboxypeptidase